MSKVAGTLGLTVTLAGYAVGSMIMAPLADVACLGRIHVCAVSLLIFVVLQVPTALATNFGMLLAFRFLSGLFGAAQPAVGGVIISDMYSAPCRSYPMTLWDVAGFFGPGEFLDTSTTFLTFSKYSDLS